MSRYGFAMIACLGIAGLAYAQTDEPKLAAPTADSTSEQPPVAGANSFTEAQAIARIEDQGFSAVTSMRKDENSIWRGQAMKDGKPVTVALDFKGNVVFSQ